MLYRVDATCQALRLWMTVFLAEQNTALMIVVTDDGRENEWVTYCGCWYYFGIAVKGDWDEENDAFLQNALFDDNEFKLMLLSFWTIRPVVQRWLSVLLLWQDSISVAQGMSLFCWRSPLARRILNCSVIFRNQIWTQAVEDQFHHAFNKTPFRYRSIKWSVPPKPLVLKSSRMLERPYIRWWIELHHFTVHLRDQITSAIRFESIVHSFTKQHYWAFLLALLRFRFECIEGAEPFRS